MKYLIATDIHGSLSAFKSLLQAYEREGANKMILLGDYYYHGPRNPFPGHYAPLEVAELIKSLDSVILVKGNCDSEVDEMVTEKKFVKQHSITLNNKTILFTHGHKVSYQMPTSKHYDAVVNGHFHVNALEIINGVKYITIASAALPLHGHPASYATLENSSLIIKKLSGEFLQEINL